MLKLHKASAGSGKTFQLTRSYIKLLLGKKLENSGNYRLAIGEHNRHRAILGVTFTNKATDEMKQRIIMQLALLADGSSKSPYAGGLCKEFNCSSEQLSHAARKALFELMADFSAFNISTIDSFFQSVLRTFARETNLTGNYEVDIDETSAITAGVGELLSSVNRIPVSENAAQRIQRIQLMDWLEAYMRHMIENGNVYNIFSRSGALVSALVKFVQNSLDEVYKLHSSEIDPYLNDPARIRTFTAQLHEAAKSCGDVVAELARKTLDALEFSDLTKAVKAVIYNTLISWSNGEFYDTRGNLRLSKTICKGAESIDDRVNKKFRHDFPADIDILLSETLSTAPDMLRYMDFYRRLHKGMFQLGLFSEIHRATNLLQNQNNSILLNETSLLLRSIISQDEAPFIYERMGLRLHHFLIDEFQDTSRLQWLNLRPLIRESLAYGHDNLIIGDEKQAIYRFRNSDPDIIIHDVPEEFADIISLHGHRAEENTNWRSASNIVRFNNTLFLRIANALNLHGIYSNVVQQVHHTERHGYVKMSEWQTQEDALNNMLTEILRQLDSGYRQSDIAILTSRRKEGQDVVDFLLSVKESYPQLSSMMIMTEEALRISNSNAVRLIVSVLKFIDQHHTINNTPSERTSLSAIINRFEYFTNGGMAFPDAVAKAFDDTTPDTIASEAANIECFNISSVVERLINRYLTPEQRASESIYLSAFQDMVLDFSSRPTPDLHSFIQWWDTAGVSMSINVPPDTDAIRVMTIHKSKGLEFACTHIPLLDDTLDSATRIRWYSTHKDNDSAGPLLLAFTHPAFGDGSAIPPYYPIASTKKLADTPFGPQYYTAVQEEIVDTLNKYYVAFTRAADELIIGYRPASSTSSALTMSGMITDAVNSTGCDQINDMAASESIDSELLIPLATEVGTPTSPRTDEMPRSAITTEAMPPYTAYDNERIWDFTHIDEIDEMATPRQRGIVLHAIMSDLRSLTDLHGAIRRRMMRGYLSPEEAKEIEHQLTDALNDNEMVAVWWNGTRRVLSERPLVNGCDNGSIDIYRPDRVVWTSIGTIDIIDYKFGDETPQKYFRQIRQYARMLKKMYPNEIIRSFLWYPLKHDIISVDVT